MNRCPPCSSPRAALCRRHKKYRLVRQDSLHPTMWINQYIVSYYRPTNMTTAMCCKSIFHLTNETVNIWSHLLGFVYFSWCQWDVHWNRLPEMGGHFTDHLVMALSLFGAQMCMLLSAAYHTFGCTSEYDRQKWLKSDIFGISAGLLAMYLSGIYTAFFCHTNELEQYLYWLLLIFAITAYVPTRGDFFDRKLIGSRIGLTHVIYTAVIVFGICPTAHWIQIHGGIGEEHVQDWLPNIVILYALTAAAFFFYVSLIPERLSPGTFDVVGCSHQWWHLLILSAMVWWQRAGLQMLEYHRMTEACSNFGSSPAIGQNINQTAIVG